MDYICYLVINLYLCGMNQGTPTRKPYETPLAVLLWLLVALVIVDFIGRLVLSVVLASTGIFDKLLQVLGM